MNEKELQQSISYFRNSTQYRIIEKYQKPQQYHIDDQALKYRGIFLDVETTGLDYTRDKIIELGIVCFEYSSDGRIFRILEEFSAYQDPRIPIPEDITQLTHISDDMVKEHNIDVGKVEQYIKEATLIIAHNVAFDRKFVETMFPNIPRKPWACLMNDINWRGEGIESNKLEYIAYRFGFFYEGHRAAIDCLAGIHVLAQNSLSR